MDKAVVCSSFINHNCSETASQATPQLRRSANATVGKVEFWQATNCIHFYANQALTYSCARSLVIYLSDQEELVSINGSHRTKKRECAASSSSISHKLKMVGQGTETRSGSYSTLVHRKAVVACVWPGACLPLALMKLDICVTGSWSAVLSALLGEGELLKGNDLVDSRKIISCLDSSVKRLPLSDMEFRNETHLRKRVPVGIILSGEFFIYFEALNLWRSSHCWTN